MDYTAEAKNIKMSPRKVRLVVDGIRDLSISNAINALMVLSNRASTPIRKVLESAVANAVNTHKADKKNLRIKLMMVNEGVFLKRFHYAARGRVRPYKRRTSHIKVILTDLKN